MKQALSWPASTLIALGVILFVDTVFTFDPSTGFLAGSAIGRYVVYALALGNIWLFSRSQVKASAKPLALSTVKTVFTLASAASVFYSIAIVIFSAMGVESVPTGHHSTAFAQSLNAMADIACAVLFMGMAVWFSAIGRKFLSGKDSVSPNMLLLSGAVILVGPVLILLREAVFRSISSHRLSIVIPVLAMLFSVGFFIALCRFLFTQGADSARRVVFWGWSIFFFGVCLALPQTLYFSTSQPYSMALVPQVIFCAALGILGACSAQWARCGLDIPAISAPSPAAQENSEPQQEQAEEQT